MLIINDTSIFPQAARMVIQDQYNEDIDYFYADLIDENSTSATDSIQPHPTDGAPCPTGSEGLWLISSATTPLHRQLSPLERSRKVMI